MKRDAAWLLRRHRDGGASDWRVQQALEEEFNQLIEERYKLSGEEGELRRSIPERLLNFDTSTSRALQMRAECRFEEWLRENIKAKAELAELRRFVLVAAELARASESAGEVESLLGTGLSELPTPTVLRRLRSLARQLLDQGEARKAQFVVLLLRSQADGLKFRGRQKPPSGLMVALGVLTTKAGTEVVDGLRKLMHEGYFNLVERITEDLESDLAVRERSRRDLELLGGSLGPLIQSVRELRQTGESVSCSLTAWLEAAAPVAGD